MNRSTSRRPWTTALAAVATVLAATTLALVAPTGTAPVGAAEQTVTFQNSGTWTVPAGVTSARVRAIGDFGGEAAFLPEGVDVPGGRPAIVQATLAVTPGEVLRISLGVGGGRTDAFIGQGGGAADVRRAPYALADRVIVAAGGGGAGGKGNGGREGWGGAGGDAGIPAGEDGTDSTGGGEGGQGATQGAAGAGGLGSQPPAATPPHPRDYCSGYAGALGVGGTGDVRPGVYAGYSSGGGGGGGYYGGGGGGGGCSIGNSWPPGGGGGGGSSYGPTGATFSLSNGCPLCGQVDITFGTQAAPSFTSASSTTFTVGAAGSFTVAADGDPDPTLTRSGALPAGVTFDAGTGALTGAPAAGTGGTYPVTFTARNGISPDATQRFTLTVREGPGFSSDSTATFKVGTAGSFTVVPSGFPRPTLSYTGNLPAGVTFDAATGALSGTPAAGTGGVHRLVFTASNGVGGDAVQNFALVVNQAPKITSAASASFATGTAGSFTVTATGYPTPRLSVSGTLPGGVTFNPSNGVLSGTPVGGTQGAYPLTFRAANGVSPDATQSFTLTVTGSGTRPPTVAIGDARVVEGDSGTSQVTFTVRRSGRVTGQSTVGYRSANGTALAPSDFAPVAGSLTFAPGETVKTVVVTVTGETTVEPDETFTVVLSGGAAISDATGVGTIIDDDGALGRFVRKVYLDALGREPDAAGKSHWVGRLSAGESRTAMATSLLSTVEARRVFVDRLYEQYLRRPGDEAGVSSVAEQLRRGASANQVRAILLGSDEYLADQGGGTSSGFVTALYRDILGRASDSAGQAYWEGVVDAGTSRPQAALRFLSTSEARHGIVADAYDRFLGRRPSSGETTFWVEQLLTGHSELAVQARIIGSQEYLDGA